MQHTKINIGNIKFNSYNVKKEGLLESRTRDFIMKTFENVVIIKMNNGLETH